MLPKIILAAALLLPAGLAAELISGTPTALPVVTAVTTTARVRGIVKELGTRDPVLGAVVTADGGGAAESDEKGAFALDCPVGGALLRFAGPGYAPKEMRLALMPGEERRLVVYLERVDFRADEVVVRGQRDRPVVTETKLSVREIKKIPGTGGDALRAVQNLPGVVTPNDFSGQLVVRGGSPADNLYLIDNMPWPVPFHFGGVLSTIDADLLANVDLYAGAFPAKWGDKQDAVLDAQTRPGRKDRLHASADLNLVLSDAEIESPLGLGDASFAFAGRRSYFDLAFKSYLGGSGFTVLPYFWDLGGSLDFSLGAHDRFHVLSIASDDQLALSLSASDVNSADQVGQFKLDNAYLTTGLNWVHTPSANFSSTFTPYFSHLSQQTIFGIYAVNIFPDTYGFREDATWELGNQRFGAGAEAAWTNYNVYGAFPERQTNPDGTITILPPRVLTITAGTLVSGAYLQDRVQFLPAWAFTGGLRWDSSLQVPGESVDPRLALEWQADPATLWRAAWGIYHQFPTAQESSSQFGNPELQANQSQQVDLGVERTLMPGLTARLEGYYKDYRNQVVSSGSGPSRFYDNEGIGDARGVELFLRANYGERFFAWASYSYSRSERLDHPADGWKLFRYDQPQVATLVGSYNLTPAFSLGAKLHYNSGPLYTPLTGRVADPSQTNGYSPLEGAPYSARLEDYLRLDLRLDYTWNFPGWKLTLYVEMLNALNRPNPAGVTYNKDYSNWASPDTVNNLPRLPYVGVEADF